jgi:hypothetical protein
MLHNDTQYNEILHNVTQYNDILHNDTQHNEILHNDSLNNDSQLNDIQHNDFKTRHSALWQSIVIPTVVYAVTNAECHIKAFLSAIILNIAR